MSLDHFPLSKCKLRIYFPDQGNCCLNRSALPQKKVMNKNTPKSISCHLPRSQFETPSFSNSHSFTPPSAPLRLRTPISIINHSKPLAANVTPFLHLSTKFPCPRRPIRRRSNLRPHFTQSQIPTSFSTRRLRQRSHSPSFKHIILSLHLLPFIFYSLNCRCVVRSIGQRRVLCGGAAHVRLCLQLSP